MRLMSMEVGVAQIIEMNNPNFPGRAKVHYTRWLGPKYDEWLPLNSALHHIIQT